MLFSDGLVERRDEDLEVSVTRLSRAIEGLRHLDADGLYAAVVDRAPGDDTTLLVLRRTS